MSYDLYLLQPVPHEDFLSTVHAKLDSDSEALNPGPLNADAELRKQDLSRALIAENPALEPFEFEYAEIARLEGISEHEARLRYRHVELNGAEDGNGIQITLSDDHVAITIPYWHQPTAARSTFEEVWRYLRVIHRSVGYLVYDPQLERAIDLETDMPHVLNEYGRVVAKIPEIIGQHRAQPNRPWWRFW